MVLKDLGCAKCLRGAANRGAGGKFSGGQGARSGGSHNVKPAVISQS